MINDKLRDKSIPPEFHQNNNAKAKRSINLAERAKKWINENNIEVNEVTEATFLEATRKVEKDGKGISHSTLYKNKSVKEIFHSLNPKFLNSKKEKKNKASKSKRSLDSIFRERYNHISKLDVIKSLEELKQEIKIQEKKNRELLLERDELKRQNDNQLVHLTRLQENEQLKNPQ